MARSLKLLSLVMGVSCALIGAYHFALGVASVPGAGSAATNDSRERFYGALFLGFGLAWIWLARQSPMPATLVRFLAGIFFLGGVGRVVSLIAKGQPHWFQNVLMVIELALPAIFFWLATADEKAATSAIALSRSN